MANNSYQYGNTIRLECNFYNFEGIPVNPDTVKITIYDYKYNIIESKTITNSEKTGYYYFDYVTEKKSKKIYYEWYGEINGKPSLKRGTFITDFM